MCPKNPHNFNVDNVRVVKLVGGAIHDSTVVNGMVLRRDTDGTVKDVANAKVAVFAQAVDTAGALLEGAAGGASGAACGCNGAAAGAAAAGRRPAGGQRAAAGLLAPCRAAAPLLRPARRPRAPAEAPPRAQAPRPRAPC